MIVRRANGPEIDAALALRIEVFCGEQGVSREAEHDALDETALHLVALDGDAVIGTCRLLPGAGADANTVVVGRVAVRRDRRGAGVGARLMRAAEREARLSGASALELHAQTASEGFYERAGYVGRGDPFLEEGIPHIAMRREL